MEMPFLQTGHERNSWLEFNHYFQEIQSFYFTNQEFGIYRINARPAKKVATGSDHRL